MHKTVRKTFFDMNKFHTGAIFDSSKKLSCASCALYQNVLHPKIAPYGKFEKKILVIGQSPGKTEDRLGKPWQGVAGQRLYNTLAGLGIDLYRDACSINSVNCRPTDSNNKNRTPTNHEIACCRKYVLQTIEQKKPKLIILAGGEAVTSIIGHRWKKNLGGISKWRGWCIPDKDFNAWICPTFHPSYVNRMCVNPGVETIFLQDLHNAIKHLNTSFPKYGEQIQIIKNSNELLSVLNRLSNARYPIEIDFETTGLRPNADGHKIVCISIADSAKRSFAFMLPASKEIRNKIKCVFADEKISKMAHNMVFEQMWAENRLHTTINNWKWCSLQAAHILDNRPGITSLKFQTYVNFGLCDYDSHIAPYLQGKEPNNANSKNKIFEFIDQYGEDSLLTYCAKDTLWGYRLALKQMDEIGVF